MIARKLKGLEDIISVNVVDWYLGPDGWSFTTPDKVPGATPDEVFGAKLLREIYFKAEPEYSGRFTVPALWDKKTNTMVSNESGDIIRMFYSEFDDLIDEKYRTLQLLPENHKAEIEELASWINTNFNSNFYKAFFANTQEDYEKAADGIFKSLDHIEKLLAESSATTKDPNGNIYLYGNMLSHADIFLFPNIIRFDTVYVNLAKLNFKMIRYDYPNIHKWLRQLYWDIPAFKETTDFEHIKKGPTKSYTKYNPFGITPVGPVPNICPKDA